MIVDAKRDVLYRDHINGQPSSNGRLFVVGARLFWHQANSTEDERVGLVLGATVVPSDIPEP
jgi:hypothetical protein